MENAILLNFYDENKIEAGCDEAGRGCLAGPVVCAAVILPKDFNHPGLNDSKKISESQRKELRKVIEEKAIAFNVQFISTDEIATLNILHASLNGMQKAAASLEVKPELVLMDGNKTPKKLIFETVAIVKGDQKYKSIAAASILAKTYRDEYMELLHIQYPQFNWSKNKGYPTKDHRKKIAEHGACIHHRVGFNLLGKPAKEKVEKI